jgi:hypothetical protein
MLLIPTICYNIHVSPGCHSFQRDWLLLKSLLWKNQHNKVTEQPTTTPMPKIEIAKRGVALNVGVLAPEVFLLNVGFS